MQQDSRHQPEQLELALEITTAELPTQSRDVIATYHWKLKATGIQPEDGRYGTAEFINSVRHRWNAGHQREAREAISLCIRILTMDPDEESGPSAERIFQECEQIRNRSGVWEPERSKQP